MVKAKSKTIYDVHPSLAMVQKWLVELEEKRAFTGGMDRAGQKRRTELREVAARMAEEQAQIGNEQRVVDRGTRGRKGLGGHAGGVFEGRRSVRGGAIGGA